MTSEQSDFLAPTAATFDYIIGNPPYVPITGITVEERTEYRRRFRCAVGRFDLYLLFFEQSLKLLKSEGRLVFVTPEKYLYVQTAQPLRRELTDVGVEEVELIAESAFGSLITYPTITTVSRSVRPVTRVKLRDGTIRSVKLKRTGSWLPALNGHQSETPASRLVEAFARISCGVATGADRVFVLKDESLSASLQPFAFRTMSGREMKPGAVLRTTHSMLAPYDRSGALLPEGELGVLGEYLNEPARRAALDARTCVSRKPWYSFHETPPLKDLLQPKILLQRHRGKAMVRGGRIRRYPSQTLGVLPRSRQPFSNS